MGVRLWKKIENKIHLADTLDINIINISATAIRTFIHSYERILCEESRRH